MWPRPLSRSPKRARPPAISRRSTGATSPRPCARLARRPAAGWDKVSREALTWRASHAFSSLAFSVLLPILVTIIVTAWVAQLLQAYAGPNSCSRLMPDQIADRQDYRPARAQLGCL